MTRDDNTDHDLLVRVDEKLNGLSRSVSDMRDGVSKQLADHEHRLRQLEADYVPNAVYTPAHQSLIKSIDSMKRIIYMAMGGWVLFTVIAAITIKFWK